MFVGRGIGGTGGGGVDWEEDSEEGEGSETGIDEPSSTTPEEEREKDFAPCQTR